MNNMINGLRERPASGKISKAESPLPHREESSQESLGSTTFQPKHPLFLLLSGERIVVQGHPSISLLWGQSLTQRPRSLWEPPAQSTQDWRGTAVHGVVNSQRTPSLFLSKQCFPDRPPIHISGTAQPTMLTLPFGWAVNVLWIWFLPFLGIWQAWNVL